MHLGLLWVLFEKFGASLLAVVAFFVYAKFLGPSDLGVVVIVLSVTQFLAILIGTLFEDVLVQKKELDSSDTDTAFWAGFGLSFLSMLATVGGFYFFSEKVETYNLTALAAFACLEIFLVNAGTIYVAQMRREGRFKLLALRVLIGRVGGSLLGLGAIFIGLGAWSVIIQSVMMAALQTLILILSAKSVPGRQFDAGKLKYFFSFGAFLALKRLSWDALVRITPLAAGATLGTSAAGLVGFAWRIVELFRSSIASGLMSYLVPHLSRMQDDLPRMGREFQSITALIAFFVTPVFLGLFAIAPYMITTIFDEKWNGTIPLIQIFCISSLLSCYRLAVPMVTTAAGLPAKMLIHNLLATGTSISILFLFGSTGLWLFGAVFIFQALVLLPKSLLVIRTILGIGVRDQLLPVVRYNLPGVAMLAVLLLSQRIFADVIWVDNLVSQVVLGMAAFTILGVAFFRKDCRKWLSGIINQ